MNIEICNYTKKLSKNLERFGENYAYACNLRTDFTYQWFCKNK